MKIFGKEAGSGLLTVLCVLALAVGSGLAYGTGKAGAEGQGSYAGSSSCRQCHEGFYKLWESSHHGLAMQPYTAEFAEANLTVAAEDVAVGKFRYRVRIEAGSGYVVENGPDGEKQYPIKHVLGGKNVYYFLTPLDRGRLQTLPVAYDVHLKKWFDTAASGVRHFPGAAADEPVHWTDPLYTFNTSCHGCHVSQLSTNYDVKTDTYHTEWAEPGINCETCHGPSQGHIDVCRAAGEGQKPKDLKIIRTTPFTAEQTNSMCGSCHAKMNNVSPSFKPGEKYFDHFDLITLEHPDFYPDGRDLGENYTMTSWRMSPCVKSSKLDCVHCHTASGRYRFSEAAKANNACLPCHKELVKNIESHTHHSAEGEASKCIACHMPMTKFAHMNRTDHSMRSPTPATTIAFKSPNACNLCHNDKDAAWSDKYVRQWWKNDYQKTVLDWAYLVDTARKGNWRDLDKILQYISNKDRDEVVAASLIRMLRMCDSEKKWPGIVKALKADSSPLVRSAAAEVLDGYFAGESLKALLAATKDEYRLVRVRAAGSLAGVSAEMLKERHKADLEKATAEFKAAMNAHPDDYISHYNFGNFYMARREYSAAISSFQTTIRLRPDYLPPYVNIAFAYNAMGKNDEAEKSFRKALTLDPNSVAAHLNLGMLLGEQSRLAEAETTFRKVFELDPNSAVAAYNLGVILAPKRPAEAIKWCEKAYLLQRDNPKYAYTYAFYLNQSNESEVAIAILQSIIKRQTPYPDAYAFLGTIYQSRGQIAKARDVYQAAAKNTKLPQQARREFDIMVRRLR